ncbi:hypothetical protein K435DRAFT_653642, partial [Dendrothele bispora CBS 962.96]
MWLKRYLDFGSGRPLWALLADTLLATNTPSSEKNTPRSIRINYYLQSWKTGTTSQSNQPPDILRMLKIGRKYGLRIEGIAFERDILREMPIWYHSQADSKIRRLTGSRASKCLLIKHNLTTVGEAEDLAAILVTVEGRPNPHENNNHCRCSDCTNLREKMGCNHPNLCMLRAQDLLDTLPTKWDPHAEQPGDNEPSLTSLPSQKDEEIFDYRLSTSGNLSDIFRIFTDPSHKPVNEVPIRLFKVRNQIQQVTVATDGSCIDNGQTTAIAGAGVFFAANDPRNQSVRVPKSLGDTTLTQSNQTAELLAVKLTS